VLKQEMREKIGVVLMLLKFRENNCCQIVAQLPSVGVSNCIWGTSIKEGKEDFHITFGRRQSPIKKEK